MLPSNSFIKVGRNLREESECNNSLPESSIRTSTRNIPSLENEEQKKQQQEYHEQQQQQENTDEDTSTSTNKNTSLNTSTGTNASTTSSTLISDGGSCCCIGSESNHDDQSLTIDTKDIEILDEMMLSNSYSSRKKHIHTMTYLFIVLLIFTVIIAYLNHELYNVRQREQNLIINNNQLVSDNKKLINEKRKLLNLATFGNQYGCGNGGGGISFDQSVFEVDNCYFNVRTTATVGECTKNIGNDLFDWYEKNIYDPYSSWYDDFFGDDKTKDEDDGPNVMNEKREGSKGKDVTMEIVWDE